MKNNTISKTNTPKSKLFEIFILTLSILIAAYGYYSSQKEFIIKVPYIHSIALIFASIATLFWRQTYNYMGDNFVDGVYKSDNLLTKGPFAMTRNPIYLSYFVLFPSILLYYVAIIHPSLVLITLIVGFGLLIGLYLSFKKRITDEEQILLEFGREYIHYKNTVPRLFPTLTNLKNFIRQPFALKPE